MMLILNMFSREEKRVRFADNVIEPKETERCHLCGFRNISPFNRMIYQCVKCRKDSCEHCTGKGYMCVECLMEDL